MKPGSTGGGCRSAGQGGTTAAHYVSDYDDVAEPLVVSIDVSEVAFT
jgi:hypothetical protein